MPTQYVTSTDSTWNTWTSYSTSATVRIPVYPELNCNSYSSTSTAVTATTVAWTEWTNAGTSTDSISGAWVYWVNGSNTIAVKKETAKEKAAREEQYRKDAEQARIAAEKRAKEAEERETKALIFLQLVLNEQQQKELKEKNYFEVSVVGGKKYRIKKGQCRNIQEMDDKTGQVKRTLCFHPQDNLHDYDAMAIQKLALESMEDEALKVANFS